MAETDELLSSSITTKLPWYRRLAFGTGHILMVLAVAMWFSYGQTFFQKYVNLGPANAGIIILVAQIFGGIFTPFIGIWSDQCVCPKPGRRKLFHLLGTIAIVCSFFFIWYDCIYCENQEPGYKILYYASWASLFQLGSGVQIAQLTLIPELGKDNSSKMELTIVRTAFLVLGNLIIFITFFTLLKVWTGSDDLNGFSPKIKPMFWVMAIVVIAVGLPISMCFQLFVKEDPNYKAPDSKSHKWHKDPDFYLRIALFICSRVTVIIPQSYLPLYLTDTLNMNQYSLALGPLIFFISSGLSTFFVKMINKCLEEKMTVFFGIAVVWASVIWIGVMEPTTDTKAIFDPKRDNIYIAIILIGFGSSTMLVVSLSMVSYLIGNNTGSSGFVYGSVLFFDRLTNGVILQVLGLLNKNNHSENVQHTEYYRYALVGVLLLSTWTGCAILITMKLVEHVQKRYGRKEGKGYEGEETNDEIKEDLAINAVQSEVIAVVPTENDMNFPSEFGDQSLSPVIHRKRAQSRGASYRDKPPEGGMTDLEESLALIL